MVYLLFLLLGRFPLSLVNNVIVHEQCKGSAEELYPYD